MNKFYVQLFSYFIILIFVLSMFGVAYMGDGNTPNETDTEFKPIPVNYEGSTQLEVRDFTKRAILVGYTNESDIQTIDKSLLRIKGISNVTSNFYLNNDTQILNSYLYRAEVSGVDLNIDLVESDYLENLQVYRYANAKVEGKITLQNSDLNVYKDYNFNDTAQVIVGPNTRVGDVLLAQIYATFLNDSLTQIVGQEYQNLTENKQISFTNTYDFDFENSNIYLQGEDYNLEYFKTLGYDFEVNDSFKLINYTFDLYDIDDIFNDLNTYINDNNLNLNAIKYYSGSVFIEEVEYEGEVYEYNDFVYTDVTKLQDNILFDVVVNLNRDENNYIVSNINLMEVFDE